jgi:hypothetical protein
VVTLLPPLLPKLLELIGRKFPSAAVRVIEVDSGQGPRVHYAAFLKTSYAWQEIFK